MSVCVRRREVTRREGEDDDNDYTHEGGSIAMMQGEGDSDR